MDVLWRAWAEASDANLFLVAGGVTYAILLALFPGLAALIAVYGLILDPSQIEQQVSALSGVLPEQTQQLLADELHTLAGASTGTLGLSAGVGLLIALSSASRGMIGMITALDIAYQEKERRGFIKLNLLAIGLTIAAILVGLVVIALVAVLPAAVQFVSAGATAKWLLLVLEWPILIAVVMSALAVLYRYAPDREKPQWRWVSPGAIIATALWIIASLAFTVYIANFNSYDRTYGSLGGVIILLTWLYISALMVLLGAAINAQAEMQTRKDFDRWATRSHGRTSSACRRYSWDDQEADGNMLMYSDKQLARLHWRLSREGLGPLTTISNEATAYLVSALRSIAAWLRHSAEDRPLITLLLSFEAGFAAARLGGRRARR